MSDKVYTLPSGKSFQALNAPGNSVEILGDKEKSAPPTSISGSTSPIDSSCDRIILNIGENKRVAAWVYRHGNKRVVSWPGGTVELDVQDLADGAIGGSGSVKPLKLTMPGKVLAVKVKVGEKVEPGQSLLVVEAMKMENVLLADAKAVIAKIHVKEGDRLESGATLITFEAPSA